MDTNLNVIASNQIRAAKISAVKCKFLLFYFADFKKL